MTIGTFGYLTFPVCYAKKGTKMNNISKRAERIFKRANSFKFS